MTNLPEELVRQRLAELRIDLEARAAGYWWHAGDWLEQVAFSASPTLDAEVARQFAEATLSVPMSRTGLGIVQAAAEGRVVVSRAAELPGDWGSGYWLRAFGAERSVAVPLHDAAGSVRAVVAVALGPGALDDDTAVARIHADVRGWLPPH